MKNVDPINNHIIYAEFAEGGVTLRNNIKQLDYQSELVGKEECYRSLFLYDQDILLYMNENKQSVSGYAGVRYADELVIDLDFKDLDGNGDPAAALIEVRKLLLHLNAAYGLEFNQVRIVFSGCKGFHVCIPAILFGGFNASAKLPDIHKLIVQELTAGFSGIDLSIYIPTGLIRIPNTIHAKTGSYSVPVDSSEIFTIKLDDLLAKAKEPCDYVYALPPEELIPNKNLEQLARKIEEDICRTELVLSEQTNSDADDFNIELPMKNYRNIENNCDYLAGIIKKANIGGPIKHTERLFLAGLMKSFGEDGRKSLHEIFSRQANYNSAITDKHINQVFSSKYGPPSCLKTCGQNTCLKIQLIHKKSPIAFARECMDKFNQSIALEKVRSYFDKLLIYQSKHSSFYYYQSGYFKQIEEQELAVILNSFLPIFFKKTVIRDADINSLIKRLKMEEGIVTEKELVTDPFIINLKNGLLNIKTRTLVPHTPEIITTRQYPVEYDPQADCPLFKEKIYEILSYEAETVDYLLKWFCYCLIATYEFQKFLVLYGTGRNGKSLLSNILIAIVGQENAAFESFKDLADDHNYSLVRLNNKIINLSSEVSSKESDIDVIKRLTGNDVITAREIYKPKVVFRNYARLIIAANSLPRITNIDKAIQERMAIIEFKKSFAGSPDTNLFTKLKKELSGIFNFIISKAPEIIREDGSIFIPEPQSIKYNVTKHINKMHSVLEFISEECEVFNYQKNEDPVYLIRRSTLLRLYTEWCSTNGYKAVGKKQFQEIITSFLGLPIEKINQVKSKIQGRDDDNGQIFKGEIWVIGIKNEASQENYLMEDELKKKYFPNFFNNQNPDEKFIEPDNEYDKIWLEMVPEDLDEIHIHTVEERNYFENSFDLSDYDQNSDTEDYDLPF